MSLAATAVRIEAPIPGKPFVGVEVPNDVRETVTIKVKEDAQPGQNEIKIFKNPDVEDIVGKEIEYLGKTFIIHEVDARDDDFDKLLSIIMFSNLDGVPFE